MSKYTIPSLVGQVMAPPRIGAAEKCREGGLNHPPAEEIETTRTTSGSPIAVHYGRRFCGKSFE